MSPTTQAGQGPDPRRVLLVEDDQRIQANLLFQLREEGFETRAVTAAEDALLELGDGELPCPDLMLLDVRLRGMSGLDLVRQLAPDDRLPPTIIISGEASISETVEALKLGVHDFIEKPFSRERLFQSIQTTLENISLKRKVADLESELAGEDTLLGESAAMETLREQIRKVAPTDGRVLIRGESGTGKELVANAVHRQSPRRDRPFIKINCAAIPSHLIEDELFGHSKGAFTDARTAKAGLFEEADGGTLFLDEIGDMEYRLQSRLLRVLEDGLVRRIGETQDRRVDVRVLAATNRHLEDRVKENEFREDLYFRLAHLPIEVPPLREREGDNVLLFHHFIERFSRRHKVRPRKIESAVLEKIRSYSWPGNIRELKNVCERVVIFGSDPITLDQLPSSLFSESLVREIGVLRLTDAPPNLPLRDFKAQCEKEYIESVLQRMNWNFTAAAKVLAIQRTYLHQKVTTLGIRRPS